MIELPIVSHIKDLKGKVVIVRVDFNVPVGANGSVDDNEAWRIESVLETIEFLRSEGAKTVLISHFGRSGESIKPVAEYLAKYFNVGFIPEVTGQLVTSAIGNMAHGSVIMLENLRKDPREQASDPGLATELAKNADYFVNEAFSSSHRMHASIVELPRLLPSFVGFNFLKEIEQLSRALDPGHPFVLILGGAKFKIKLDLLKQFVDIADTCVVGGALVHTFWKESGQEIGKSLVDEVNLGHLARNENIFLPVDVVVRRNDKDIEIPVAEILPDDVVFDIGTGSLRKLSARIKDAKMILWNGPLGNYENGYGSGTHELARMIANSSAMSIVGGGDTVAAIKEIGLEEKFNFVSTAGGAMLDFLVDKTLPGIDAILYTK